MKKKSVVQLRVYRGTTMSYDEQGKAQNENQPVKINYPSFEWDRFLKHLRLNGYCKVEAERFIEVSVEGGKETVKDLEVPAEIKSQVSNAFNPKTEKVETPEQKRIAELERKIEELSKGSNQKKDTKDEDAGKDIKSQDVVFEEVNPKDFPDMSGEVSERDKLIEEYKQLFGKGIFNGWTNEQIAEKIAEEKNKS